MTGLIINRREQYSSKEVSENISRGKRRKQKNNKHKIFNESSVYHFHISHAVKRQKQLTHSSTGKPIDPLDGFEISLLQSCTGIYKKQYNKLPLLMELSGRMNNGHSENNKVSITNVQKFHGLVTVSFQTCMFM